MTRFKRNRSYDKPKPKDATDPKWAGRYLVQNFEFSRLAAIIGVDVQRCVSHVERDMQARKCTADKAFTTLLNDAIGELQRMRFRIEHDPDLTDYDEQHYCADNGVKCYWEESTGKWRHFCERRMTEAEAPRYIIGADPARQVSLAEVNAALNSAIPLANQRSYPVFPEGCLMREPATNNAEPMCRPTPQGPINHHPNCPIEPTQADADALANVCSDCENTATVVCKRCQTIVCDDCFTHYHFSGKRHELC